MSLPVFYYLLLSCHFKNQRQRTINNVLRNKKRLLKILFFCTNEERFLKKKISILKSILEYMKILLNLTLEILTGLTKKFNTEKLFI